MENISKSDSFIKYFHNCWLSKERCKDVPTNNDHRTFCKKSKLDVYTTGCTTDVYMDLVKGHSILQYSKKFSRTKYPKISNGNQTLRSFSSLFLSQHLISMCAFAKFVLMVTEMIKIKIKR